MTSPGPASPVDPALQPRPTQAAFEPGSKKDLMSGLGVGLICLLGFGLGLGWWLNVTIAATLDSVDVRASSLEQWLPFIFPIFLPIAGYFWWDSWRRWRDTRAFERGKQTTSGTITHLWIDPPRPPGKKYYVGFHYGQGNAVYQQVHSRTFSRLTLGQEVIVEYVPGRPRLSRLNLRKQKRPAPTG